MTQLENFNEGEPQGSQSPLWQGEEHPYSSITPGDPVVRTAAEPQYLEIPSQPGRKVEAASEIPAPIQQAIEKGAPIRFSTASENAEAGREPDFFFTPEGKLVPNPKATPSPDGSINIEMQAAEAKHKSLADAIEHRTEMQRKAAEEMIRLFQKAHPGQPVPSWMEDLVNARPNIPDFVPFPPRVNEPVTPPPENGFVNRGVNPRGGGDGAGGGGGSRGISGYAGNGGFDSQGNFKGNGSAGDGVLNSGHYDGKGKPLGDGQVVKAKEIYDYLTEHHGFTPEQASGILGNMQTESSFNTSAYNKAEGAIGLIQWEGSRRTALEAFAAKDGRPVTDWKLQVDFMVHELKTSESGAWEKIKDAQTPAQVAAAFDKYYERSAGTSRGERMANAENIYKTIATA